MTTTKDLEEIRRGALHGLPMATVQPPVIEAPENSLIKQLKNVRKLTDEVVSAFEIEPYKFGYQWGWIYPAGNGQRWKNANNNHQPKYAWIPLKPVNAMIYHAPDLLQHIRARGGVVWLVTEADVWTLRAAGTCNALSLFGEFVPDNLGDMLLSMGVTRVLIAPDRDNTGAAFIEKINAVLWGASIKLTCYKLPFEQVSKHGGDIGKAWQQYTQPEPFEFWLMQLSQVEVKEPAPIHTIPAPVYSFSNDPLSEIRQTIISRLGVSSFGADNFSVKKIACKFHDDQHPSAHLHIEKGLYCHTEARWYTWKELAGTLGIDWNFSTVTTTAPALIVGITGMSREARRVLIAMGLTNLARAFDLLIHKGKTGEIMTLAQFTACLLPALSIKTSRVTYEYLQGKNLPAKAQDKKELLSKIPLSYLQQEEGVKVGNNSKVGRPQIRLRIPSEAELNTALQVVPTTYYAMSSATLADAAQYRAACFAHEIYRKPGKYARKQLAAPLGVSFKTIKAYCKRANITRTPTPPKVTELTPAQVVTLPENHNELRLMILQKKIKSNVYLQDERGARHEYTQAGAQQAAMMGGGKLYRVEYQASDYRPMGAL